LTGSRFLFLTCLASSVAAGVLVDGSASAQQERVDTLDSGHRRYESPQNFSLELRFGLYKPAVDGDPALHGATPYASVFGTGPLVEVGAEFSWQALRIPHFGTLGPGIGVGYANASGDAPFQQEHNGTFVSGEKTSLLIVPFYAVAVLRADALWREVGIPFVPYVKAGLGFALWRASNTLGTSTYDGVSGTGDSLGTFLAVGLGFNLNVFDRYAAQNFDDAMGVNATYVFVEGTREDLSGLGVQSDPLRVGSTNWTFGLNLEF
jgi:hypothetical protein